MKHVGDITKLHGYDLPPVDVINGGSPCQDLSVAGKRAGMLHEANGDAETTRSGLFYDQVRILKEMREAYVQEPAGSDQLVRGVRYPRYSIWENVPGALSAGKEKGEAFQAVLTEFVRIVEPDAPPVPMPDKGKWPTAGCLYDPMGRWSVAWRVHDLQFWGCPQRRKRLCVLCDFDGTTAPWILFDPQFRREAEDTTPIEAESDTRTDPRSEVQPLGEGVCGNPVEGCAPGQGAAEGTEDGSGGASFTLKVRGGIEVDSHGRKAGKGALVQTELSGTLRVSQDQTLIQPCLNPQDPQSKRVFDPNGVAPTINSGTCEGKNIVPSVCLNPWDVQSKHIQPEDGIAEALYSGECRYGGGESYVMAEGLDAYNQEATGESTMTLTAKRSDPNHVPCVLPINTMVGTRDTPEMRTTFGVGEPDDPQFTLSSAHEHAVFVDVYNQSVDGEVAASLTAASGGTNTSGPKVMSAGFKPRQGAAARDIGFAEEQSPTILTDLNAGVLCLNDQGGKGGANYAEDVCPAVLSDSHGTPHAVAYSIDKATTTGGNCTAGGDCAHEEYTPPLTTDRPHAVAYGISAYDSNAMKSSNPHSGIYEADSSRTLDLNGGSPACNQGGVMILNPTDSQGNRIADADGSYPTLRGAGYQQGYCFDHAEPVPIEGNGQRESHRGDGYGESGDPMFTLNSTEHHAVAGSYQDTTGALMASGYDKLGTQEAANDMYVVGRSWDGTQTAPTPTQNNAGGNQRMPDKDNFNAVLQEGVECMQNGWYQSTGDQAPSLLARDYKDPPVVKKPKSVVRRLTPVECERLQGFPDGWTDLGEWTDSKGKKHKDADSPRYKALGNSIGLPFWQWLADRIAAQYDRPVTLGSLFDGISGFCVCFKRAGGVPVWSSEIEEFCVAVAKKHFGDDDTGEVGDFDEAIQRSHKT